MSYQLGHLLRYYLLLEEPSLLSGWIKPVTFLITPEDYFCFSKLPSATHSKVFSYIFLYSNLINPNKRKKFIEKIARQFEKLKEKSDYIKDLYEVLYKLISNQLTLNLELYKNNIAGRFAIHPINNKYYISFYGENEKIGDNGDVLSNVITNIEEFFNIFIQYCEISYPETGLKTDKDLLENFVDITNFPRTKLMDFKFVEMPDKFDKFYGSNNFKVIEKIEILKSYLLDNDYLKQIYNKK